MLVTSRVTRYYEWCKVRPRVGLECACCSPFILRRYFSLIDPPFVPSARATAVSSHFHVFKPPFWPSERVGNIRPTSTPFHPFPFLNSLVGGDPLISPFSGAWLMTSIGGSLALISYPSLRCLLSQKQVEAEANSQLDPLRSTNCCLQLCHRSPRRPTRTTSAMSSLTNPTASLLIERSG